MVRVVLPQHLRTLANLEDREVKLDVPSPVTPRAIVDAIEARFPMLLGTIRDRVTKQRRPLVRFFACEEDVSLESPEFVLPQKIASGEEPFFIVGAIAGGYDRNGNEERGSGTGAAPQSGIYRSSIFDLDLLSSISPNSRRFSCAVNAPSDSLRSHWPG